MWLCTNHGFYSVVADRRSTDMLLVRARRRGDLVALFGKRAKIIETPTGTDYRFRVVVPRSKMAEMIAKAVEGIAYPNFKDSVRDPKLHDMYSLWWGDHRKLQTEAARDLAGEPA